jgi:hypothetical protein
MNSIRWLDSIQARYDTIKWGSKKCVVRFAEQIHMEFE